jgi:hypothetical protein
VIRTTLFIDYAYTCEQALESIGTKESSRCAMQIDSRLLAEAIAALSPPGRPIDEIRTYRAVPNGRVDLDGYSATLRQLQRWDHDGVTVIWRPMQEEPEGVPAESSARTALAVALAIDLAVMAWRDQYDIALICSSDPALLPGIRAVLDQTWKIVEVVGWHTSLGSSRRIEVRGEHVPCHWLDGQTSSASRDITDYSKPPDHRVDSP